MNAWQACPRLNPSTTVLCSSSVHVQNGQAVAGMQRLRTQVLLNAHARSLPALLNHAMPEQNLSSWRLTGKESVHAVGRSAFLPLITLNRREPHQHSWSLVFGSTYHSEHPALRNAHNESESSVARTSPLSGSRQLPTRDGLRKVLGEQSFALATYCRYPNMNFAVLEARPAF